MSLDKNYLIVKLTSEDNFNEGTNGADALTIFSNHNGEENMVLPNIWEYI